MQVETKKIRIQAFKVKDFVSEKGETVKYAIATIIDEEGGVLEVPAKLATLEWVNAEAPCDGVAVFDIFMAEGKNGYRVPKLKMVDFTNEV